MSEKFTFEILSHLSPEDLIVILGLLAFLAWGLAIFLFGRISVKHIERAMTKEGIEQPVWDKGIGSIIVTYSLIMVFPRLNPTIVDFEAVRRHTRNKDKRLAFFLQISSAIFFTIIFTAYYLYGPES
jgi:hypothetical protein